VSTATQQTTARFVSKGRNYRAILLDPVDHPHPITGGRVEDQRGFTAEFARQPFEPKQHDSDGSFEWPPESMENVDPETLEYVDPVSGERVDVVKALREHPHNGQFFVEVGPDPSILIAEQHDLLEEIPRLAMARDLERLAEIYDEEENGHKREPVLAASLSALRAVEEAIVADRKPE
jgi:hypothetical protein